MAVPGDSKFENECHALRQTRSFHSSCRIYISCSCRDSRAGACRAGEGSAASACFRGQAARTGAAAATHDDPWHLEAQPMKAMARARGGKIPGVRMAEVTAADAEEWAADAVDTGGVAAKATKSGRRCANYSHRRRR